MITVGTVAVSWYMFSTLLGVLAGAMAVWWYALVLCALNSQPAGLYASLTPLQAVLDECPPDEPYMSFNPAGPIFLKPAEPRLFMKLFCFADDKAVVADVIRSMREHHPRFIFGVGQGFWIGSGQMLDLPMDLWIRRNYVIVDPLWGIARRRPPETAPAPTRLK
ncbi:MAG: hypothetical protein HY718_14105 [Planctomycetes bacterium]|nr:hypothetical protein [Planctomycetota bacterium]